MPPSRAARRREPTDAKTACSVSSAHEDAIPTMPGRFAEAPGHPSRHASPPMTWRPGTHGARAPETHGAGATASIPANATLGSCASAAYGDAGASTRRLVLSASPTRRRPFDQRGRWPPCRARMRGGKAKQSAGHGSLPAGAAASSALRRGTYRTAAIWWAGTACTRTSVNDEIATGPAGWRRPNVLGAARAVRSIVAGHPLDLPRMIPPGTSADRRTRSHGAWLRLTEARDRLNAAVRGKTNYTFTQLVATPHGSRERLARICRVDIATRVPCGHGAPARTSRTGISSRQVPQNSMRRRVPAVRSDQNRGRIAGVRVRDCACARPPAAAVTGISSPAHRDRDARTSCHPVFPPW